MLKIIYNYFNPQPDTGPPDTEPPHFGPVIRSSDGQAVSFRLAIRQWLSEGRLVVMSAGKTSKVFHCCKEFTEPQKVVFVDLRKWDFLLLDKTQEFGLSKFPICNCGEVPGSITDRKFVILS